MAGSSTCPCDSGQGVIAACGWPQVGEGRPWVVSVGVGGPWGVGGRQDSNWGVKPGTGDRRFVCDVCGRSYKRRDNLSQHQRTHTGEKPYGWLFPGPSGGGGGGGDRVARAPTCAYCGRCFARLDTLKQHLVIHTGERPYKCRDCGHAFRYRMALTRHRTKCPPPALGRAGRDAAPGILGGRSQRGSYDASRPHICSFCGKRFLNTSHLRDHLRLHTGERPFTCHTCGRTFVQRQHLRQHERTAKCAAPVCLTCNQTFSNREALSLHMQLHLLPPPPSSSTATFLPRP
ncbi:hypothetical protein Pmani_029735 [Petrolisthes manimaculis]|uniref:C2H2-type domain-containing protein n=1 Tax=Petrolisthes manimaculis TaxID=1843537 RepID=A0AAE1NZD9_9EUCA|nr:hypothetical protein Pmani_029735 [Petrolisthes manimaculis]